MYGEGFFNGLKWQNIGSKLVHRRGQCIARKVITEVKDLTFFHTKLKSPVPVYGRTGFVTSILRCLICDLSHFREKGI